MKRIITTLILALALLPVLQLKAQVKIGDNPTTINAGSVLEMESTDKGVLFPRVNLTDLTKWQPLAGTAIAGMTVYNTNTTTGVGLYYWDGAKWVKQLTSNNDAWLTTGNAATAPATNFIGTTDNQPLNFRINDKQSMILNTKNQLLISDTNAIASNFIYPGIWQYTGGKLAVQGYVQYSSGYTQKGVTEIDGGSIKLSMRQNARPSSQGGSGIEFIGGDENITTEKMKMCATVLKRYVKDANNEVAGNSFFIANRDLYPNTDMSMFNSSIGLMADKSIRFFTSSGNLLDLDRVKMSILENGNVGIGRGGANTPLTEKLEVAGKIKSTAAIFTNLPVYGSDADADADANLPSGSLYRLSGTGRQVFVKP